MQFLLISCQTAYKGVQSNSEHPTESNPQKRERRRRYRQVFNLLPFLGVESLRWGANLTDIEQEIGI